MSTYMEFQYVNEQSLMHRLDARTKILLFIIWATCTFMFIDIRVLGVLMIIGFSLFPISKVPFRRIRRAVLVMILFLSLTAVTTNILTPSYAGIYVKHQTILFSIGNIDITQETLFYCLTLMVKYLALLPFAILFVLTTNPSVFASSLHKLGIPYKIAYSLNIAFRYIPNVQGDYNQISSAQQARGLGKGHRNSRIKRAFTILFPLIWSSLDRVETISNAMDLRGFGNKKSRSWYNNTQFSKLDLWTAIIALLFLGVAIYLRLTWFPTFWHPFEIIG
ncbi:energy-coupling factor transporter transmembrane component T family protein [Risungbinella massiliensis]|uniref:energy-coupling factor transporter transmembrane component T family protein n=1 Tax=Risungbinella massiliensis TaxID=1329796 RepID=UPI00069C4FFB|nr:energy-coupling factor transporter transmembrane component T [Risungbinella massiliensis]